MVHCLFEQSGTFKNEFKNLGFDAMDYDVLNNFGETDNIIDLFEQIDLAYDNEPSIFDNISEDDLVLVFFPCIRFVDQARMLFLGNANQQQCWDDKQKVQYSMKLHNELSDLYNRICKLFCVCLDRNIKLVVENPTSVEHYLTKYFPIKAKVVDTDRTNRGDSYRKPTQYWFVNCEPANNFIFGEFLHNNNRRAVEFTYNKVERSMISGVYANRFIREFLLSGDTTI